MNEPRREGERPVNVLVQPVQTACGRSRGVPPGIYTQAVPLPHAMDRPSPPPPDRTTRTIATAAAVAVLAGLAAAFAPAGLAVRGTLAAALIAASAIAWRAWWVGRRRSREAAGAAERAERARRDQAERLRSEVQARDLVLGAMADGVVLFAPDGRTLYENDAARSLLGRRFDTTKELTPSRLREAVAAARAADAPVESALEVSGRSLAVAAVPSTPPGAVVLLVRDVTAARRVEALRTDFVANASHELKTPVAAILALADALQGAAADGDAAALARFLVRLEEEANRLNLIVSDLLDLSRLEGGSPRRARVRLDAVVARECRRLEARARERALRMTIDELAAAEVLGSRADLGLLVHNLVDNAMRYTDAGGEVRVSVRVGEGWAELSVEDTGVGIPTRALDRVFERFYRVDAARSRQTGGTGLGLAIVKHVAEGHGGTVTVRSVLGAGSTFTVRIPLATAAAGEGEVAAAEPQAGGGGR